ncbi:gliding motility-associated C-terminal domain-containing protein [Subsaxibacter sp. CAU 1640]|nr:gliding motility-associated C-terminal domain-containing protein [Subsaxibacter sp. CAU 1640]
MTNEGNASITNVVLDDPMLGGTIALSSGDTDSDGELDVDEIWIYTSDYTITQTDIDAGQVSNQATVTGTSTGGVDVSDLSDDNSITEDDTTVTTLCQSAAIALIKTGVFNDGDGDSCSDVGETITYTFTVTNEGNASITNVVLDDPMLGGTIALSSGDTDSDGELDVDEIWIYTSDYTITQVDIDLGVVMNQATVIGVSNGTNVSDLSDDNSILENDITEVTLCIPNIVASISLEKVGVFNDTNGDGSAQAGETISYSFTLYNTGDSTLFNIVLEDELPNIMMSGNMISQLLSGETDNSTYTATYVITDLDIINGFVTNQATVIAMDSNGERVTDDSDDPFNFDNIDNNNDGEPDDPTVTILPEILAEEFEIFNAVSPDGDGQNDFFRIVGIENYPNNNLKIFNRWGVLLYEMDGYGINGKVFRGVSEGRVTVSKNEELPTGSYFYVLKRFVSGGETLTNEGYLYIKRN